MSDRRRRLLLVAGALALLVIVAATVPIFLPPGADLAVAAIGTLGALVLFGPLFVFVLFPLAREEPGRTREIVIGVASLAPGALVSLIVLALANGHGLAEPAVLGLLFCLALVVGRLAPHRRSLNGPILLLGVTLALLPWTRDLVIISLLLAQAVAFVALTRFRRPIQTWIKASAAATATIVLGLGVVIVVRGSLFPPRLILDEDATLMFLTPVALLAVAVFVAVLARGKGGVSSLPSPS